MTLQNTTTTIQFPPATAEQEVKLERFIKTVGEFMDGEIVIEKVTIIQAKVLSERQDIATILRKVAAKKPFSIKKASASQPGAEA